MFFRYCFIKTVRIYSIEYTVEIAEAAVKAEKAELKICAIDLENCRVKMVNCYCGCFI